MKKENDTGLTFYAGRPIPNCDSIVAFEECRKTPMLDFNLDSVDTQTWLTKPADRRIILPLSYFHGREGRRQRKKYERRGE